MGQKVSPKGLRFGIINDWHSRWIASSKFETAEWIMHDDKIRKLVNLKYRKSFIDRIEVERSKTKYDLFIYASQPTLILGNDTKNIDWLKKEINKIVGRSVKVSVNVITVEIPDLSAAIIAREVADAIENRVSFRNAQKMAIKKVMKAGAKGVRTHVSGRLGGVEMAREEGYSEGNTPLTTLRANIDYALAEAHTTYGLIGCKVWINKGEVFTKKNNKKESHS
jgi:small subunit ribosomal protein S3